MATEIFDATSESGYLSVDDSSWSDARTATTAENLTQGSDLIAETLLEFGYYWIYRGFLWFNTSSLPDTCIINSVTLKIYPTSITDDNTDTLHIVDSSAGNSLEKEDYDALADTSEASETLANLSTDTYNSISISDTSLINKTGVTTLGVRLDTDLNDSAPGSGETNKIVIDNQTNKIQLVIDISYPNPSVTTDSATNVDKTSSTLNGELTAIGDGSNWADCWFLYSSQGNATNETTKERKTSIGTYSKSLTGLSSVTEFNYKATAENEQERTDTGSAITFYTTPYPPTNANFTTYAPSGVELTWTSGNFSTSSMIRYSANVIPQTTSDGEQIYFDSGQSTVHSAQRTTGDTHYYRIWSYNSGGSGWDVYSADYETLAISFEEYCKNVTQDVWYGDLEGALVQVAAGDNLLLSGNYTQYNSLYDITVDGIQISGQDKSAEISGLTLTDVSGVTLKSFTMTSSLTFQTSSNYCTVYDISSNSNGFGVKLIDSYRNTISGNKIYQPSNQGIYATGSNTYYNYIYDNDIYSGSKWGIKIDNSVISANIWKHNLISANTSGGIYV